MNDVKDIILSWQEREEPNGYKAWLLDMGDFIYKYLYNDMCMDDIDISKQHIQSVFEGKVLENFSGNVAKVYELDNNIDVIYHFYNSLTTNNDLDINNILKLHKMIAKNIMPYKKFTVFGERPGEFRKSTYSFGAGLTGVVPDLISSEMTKLMSFLKIEDVDPIKIASVFHCTFQSIHPFALCNGRMGRLLTNYYLISRNYPPIVFFAEDKDEYFRALRAYDEDPYRADLMYKYLIKSMMKTWEEKPGSSKDLLSILQSM